MSYEPTQPGNHTTPVYHNPYEHTTPTDPYGKPFVAMHVIPPTKNGKK